MKRVPYEAKAAFFLAATMALVGVASGTASGVISGCGVAAAFGLGAVTIWWEAE